MHAFLNASLAKMLSEYQRGTDLRPRQGIVWISGDIQGNANTKAAPPTSHRKSLGTIGDRADQWPIGRGHPSASMPIKLLRNGHRPAALG